jgi:predicted  nucleic acid-binding Zn-ribbon protein
VAALTIDVDLSQVLAGQQAVLAAHVQLLTALARIEQKVDQIMTEQAATQADVQAVADQLNALSGRVESAIVILQEFEQAHQGTDLNLGPVRDALAHLTGDVQAVEDVAAAETPAPPPGP